MDNIKKAIEKQIQALTLTLITLDGEDIPRMGEMLNQLTLIKNQSRELSSELFTALAAALERYMEMVVLRETDDLAPFEAGVEHLQSLWRSLGRDEVYGHDLTDIFSALGADINVHGKTADGDETGKQLSSETCSCRADAGDEPAEAYFESPGPDLDEEDRDIIAGFVVESMEGLETVEVCLMELEQNSEDPDSINAIFRSFHTIKGVSSFLKFMRINRLSHSAENLLDLIRGGDLGVTPEITDIILESVDLLKQMIHGVQTGLETGSNLDIGIGIGPTVARIDAASRSANVTEPEPLGEILIAEGAATKEDVESALTKQKEEPCKKIGEILVEAGSVNQEQVASALQAQRQKRVQRADLQVKVDTKKLDNLVDMTGELVIAQAMLRQHPLLASVRDQSLIQTLGQLSQITSTLQAVTMSLRMVPIKSTFQKMLRLVRDLARNSGKKVKLTMQGEDTEIDRNVVDELYEPMVHMIRNSVDHGLETPEERQAAGKSAVGRIRLKAYHRGGNIIVEICDDGRGLDKSRIIEKARASGLIADDTKLQDDEIYNLIFQPGFSTAKEVSEISGRGVGMDVVRQAIEKLRGRVEISTKHGQGSTFSITLPLTLAIIEGMLVRVGKDRFIIPALAIIECFRPTRKQYNTVKGKGEMILSREKLIPLVRLEKLFNCEADVSDPCEGLIVTVEYDGKLMCLLLDELLGKEEVVIKSMGEIMKAVKGIAGGAILGDGKVGLILDMAGIWQMAMD